MCVNPTRHCYSWASTPFYRLVGWTVVVVVVFFSTLTIKNNIALLSLKTITETSADKHKEKKDRKMALSMHILVYLLQSKPNCCWSFRPPCTSCIPSSCHSPSVHVFSIFSVLCSFSICFACCIFVHSAALFTLLRLFLWSLLHACCYRLWNPQSSFTVRLGVISEWTARWLVLF